MVDIIMEIETSVYTTVEHHYNCAVEVLTNTVTGEVSIGWTPMDSDIAEQWMAEDND